MTRSVLVAWAILSRVTVYTTMMIADVVIHDHNPGDDVLRLLPRPKPLSSPFEDSGKKECQWGEDTVPPPVWQQIMVSPITKWDGARFLSLAIQEGDTDGPTMRDPSLCTLTLCKEISKSNENTSMCTERCHLMAEEAHAFFPGFPTIVGRLMRLCRQYLSIPEVTAVGFAALLLNTACFIVAMLALYDLTLLLVPHRKRDLATTVALLFVWNPASVFFTAAYSEALFAASSWTGHVLWTAPTAELTTSNEIGRLMLSTLSRIAAVFCWMIASWTRSNGMINAVWLLGAGVCQSVHMVVFSERPLFARLQKLAGVVLIHGLAALCVLHPIRRHERLGRHFHCDSRTSNPDYRPPEWCTRDDDAISLYGYVQRTHWNVGFLRYYEWKQLPNFLLAAPVLCYGFMATYAWIRASWVRCPQKSLVPWMLYSMHLAGSPPAADSIHPSKSADRHLQPLLGPQLLVHYAVLAAVATVGLLVAHVQISTRLLLSSCPALYWYLATVCQQCQVKPGILKNHARLIVLWCIAYNVIGIALHVNFLPWT